jgi:DNA polymerase-3 subunit delta
MAPRGRAEPAFDASMRIVVLRGPERFIRDEHTRRIVALLEAAHGAIDRFSFDGATVEPAVVLDELRSYGLLQQHKLVLVDQADRMLATGSDDADAPSPPPAPRGRAKSRGGPPPPRPVARRTPRELFERYAAEPVDSATLLLRADTWRPGRIDKLIEKVGAIVACEAPDAARAAGWCTARCPKAHGCAISPAAAALLVERIGPDLARLDAELGKLAAYVSAGGSGGTIDAEAIRALVGLTREEQAWTIQSELLASADADRAQEAAGPAVAKLRELMLVSQQPEQLLSWAMIDLVRRLHAASSMHAAGAGDAAIAKELRLWGDTRGPILGVARRVPPRRLARLLDRAIASDLRVKRGAAEPVRSLESLAVEIADTLSA